MRLTISMQVEEYMNQSRPLPLYLIRSRMTVPPFCITRSPPRAQTKSEQHRNRNPCSYRRNSVMSDAVSFTGLRDFSIVHVVSCYGI